MPDEADARERLVRFVQGDREAFEALFRQYEREVYRWIVRIVRDPAAAEDAVIATFWRAYRSRARFDPSRRFGGWLRRIATNAAIDQLKDLQRRRWVPLDDGRSVQPGAAAARGGTVDADLGDSVARAMRALPPKLQVVATLALIEERPQAEIADALGIPLGTVKSRLSRATDRLRKELARLGVHT